MYTMYDITIGNACQSLQLIQIMLFYMQNMELETATIQHWPYQIIPNKIHVLSNCVTRLDFNY